MDFNDLKAEWQNAGSGSIDEKSLRIMMKVIQHPTLKKLRLKMFIEAVLMTLVLFVYYDGFDGDKKPFYVNFLLVVAIVCHIMNNMIGYMFIKNPITADSILSSMRNLVITLKRMSIMSMIFSIIYACALLFFFTSSIVFTPKKYVLLAIMIVTSISVFYFSFKDWKAKIGHFEKIIFDLTSH